MAKQKDFFFSYNKTDRHWARGICDWLEDAGKSVIMQEADFHPGSNFPLEMNAALKGAKRMIGVLSPDYLMSEFCQSEWAAKFREDPTGRLRLLVFVKVRECDLSGLIGSIVHINLVGLDVTAAASKLLTELESTISPPKFKKRASGAAIVKAASKPPAEKPPPSEKTTAPTIRQTTNAANSQNIGIQNVGTLNNITTQKTTVRNIIQPGPEHISPADRTKLHELLEEVGGREAMVKLKKRFPDGPQTDEEQKEAAKIKSDSFRFLRGDFNRENNDGQSYHLLPKEKLAEAVSWISQRKAMKRKSLRRADNETWRRDHEIIIWGGMRTQKWQKQDVYDFAISCGAITSPIKSLKELRERELEALA